MAKKTFDPIVITARGWDYPRKENGRVDKVAIKKDYMASPHLSWSHYVKAKGWDYKVSTNELPTNDWLQEKKETIAIEQGDILGSTMFEHRFQYQNDILATLKKFPKEHDRNLTIIVYQLNVWERQIAADLAQEKTLGRMLKLKERQFKASPMEIQAMTGALAKLTESKYKSLLMNDWSAIMFNEFKPDQAKEKALGENAPFEVKLIGGNKLTTNQMQEYIAKYIDKPVQVPDDSTET